VGYKLRRWLALNLPDGVSSGERLVALEIADQADDETRRATGVQLDDVVRRTGFANTKQVGKVLGKLAANGVEMRVAVGKREDGSPVFAYEGRRTMYRVPEAGEIGPVVPLPGEHSPEVPQAGDHSPSGPPDGAERSPARGQEVPQAGDLYSSSSPQRSSSSAGSSTHVTYVVQRLQVDDDEATQLINTIRERHAPRSIGAYLRGMDDGDLRTILDELRPKPAAVDRGRPPYLDAGPCVPHGTPHGSYVNPVTGEPRCGSCRRGVPPVPGVADSL
jgi:hypothetical protein